MQDGGASVAHVVPVWYMYEDGSLYIGTNSQTVKAKNVTRTGRASFCVDAGVRTPIFGVVGQGKAELLRDDITEIATRILLRYYTSMKEPGAAELLSETDCIIRIIPDKTTSWSY